MLVQKAPEPIAPHGQLADLAADHHPATPGAAGGACRAPRRWQRDIGRENSQEE
jgi:hypothetical protein